MGKSRLIGELRKKAIQTLRESTDTLEQAFLNATGRSFEDEPDDDTAGDEVEQVTA